MTKVIKINEKQHKFILNEINHIASKSNITVASLEDFKYICNTLSINDSKLVYLLIGAIQEQQKEIESLKAKIDSKIV